jgi:hypothetical protein
MTKREFCAVLGLGAGAALARPVTAWADRIRILGGGPDLAGPVEAGQVSPEWRKFLAGVRVGARRAHGALQVFWLHVAPAAAPLAVATLEEARGRGVLLISERDRASVPSLVVENRGKSHVLFLAGEILLGGKQNRVVTEDILLPPLSGPVDLQVYCVEQGRWSADARSGGTTSFGARGTFAAPALRSKVMERGSQRDVWAEVDRYSARAAAPSATGSYQAIYDKPEVKAHQDQVEGAIDARTMPGASGAAVFVGGSFTGLDLFQDASLFTREWPKLLRAHAVEAYGRPVPEVDERALRARVEEVLKQSGVAQGSLRRNAGAGRLFEFRVDRARGAALVAEGQVVHAAIL